MTLNLQHGQNDILQNKTRDVWICWSKRRNRHRL